MSLFEVKDGHRWQRKYICLAIITLIDGKGEVGEIGRRGIVAFLKKGELDIQQNKEPRNAKAMFKRKRRMIFITKHLSASLTKSLHE